MNIHSETSKWNLTIYDTHVNLLRTTTEAMSAALGSTDSLTVLPFDISHKSSNDFSERVARNQQIVLKEEAYFFTDRCLTLIGGRDIDIWKESLLNDAPNAPTRL